MIHPRYSKILSFFILAGLLLTSGCVATTPSPGPSGSSATPTSQVLLPTNAISPTSTSEQVSIPTSQPAPTSPTIPTAAAIPTSASTTECFQSLPYPFAFLPGSQTLLVRGTEGVQVIDLLSLKQVDFIPAMFGLNDPVVALSHDGKVLGWSLPDGAIQLITLSDHSILAEFPSGQVAPVKLKFSADGTLFTVSHDGTVKHWDQGGKQLSSFQSDSVLVNIGISPDGSILATVPTDGPVSLWKTSDFSAVRQLGGTGGYDTSDAVFSPDGKLLASDLASGTYVWNIQDGNMLVSPGNPISGMAVDFSPDGRLLVYSQGNEVILSSPDTSQTILTLSGHQSPVFEVLFSPDSSLVVSTDSLEVRVWQVKDGRLLAIGKAACP